MAEWTQKGSEIQCHTCGATFRVGHSCGCVSVDSERDPDPPAPGDVNSLSRNPGAGGSLLSVESVLERMAELAHEVRAAGQSLAVKRAEAELKILRAIVEVATRNETAARLRNVEGKLADLENALAHARGFAGRLDQSPMGAN